MQCSVCQSTNLVKVSLAYEQGLSEYNGRSRSRGLFLGTGGLGLWGGRAKTTGTFQTRLSARLSPPTKWSYWNTSKWWLAGLFALWFLRIALMPHNPHKAAEFNRDLFWALEAYTAALLFFWWLAWRYNHRVFPVKRKRWDHSFMCRRCGKTIQFGG
jgi:hypothetical protein